MILLRLVGRAAQFAPAQLQQEARGLLGLGGAHSLRAPPVCASSSLTARQHLSTLITVERHTTEQGNALEVLILTKIKREGTIKEATATTQKFRASEQHLAPCPGPFQGEKPGGG